MVYNEVLQACPTRRRPRRRPGSCCRDYVFRLAWDYLGIPPDELSQVAGDREVWVSLLRPLPPRPNPRWMHILTHYYWVCGSSLCWSVWLMWAKSFNINTGPTVFWFFKYTSMMSICLNATIPVKNKKYFHQYLEVQMCSEPRRKQRQGCFLLVLWS